MSRKSTLIASSLSVCAATASWAVLASAEEPNVQAELLDTTADQLQKDAQETVYQYLNPVAINWQGDASVETKSLAYRVQKGDTLSKIGDLFQVNYEGIASTNKIHNPDKISTGDDLKVEVQTKLVSVPSADLTTEMFAEQNRIDLQVLLQLNPTVTRGETLTEGKLLRVLVSPQQVEKETSFTKLSVRKDAPKANKSSSKVVQFHKGPVQAPKEGFTFKWPVKGQITSSFGWRNGRQHQGMDIWHSAKTKAPIQVALSGVVTKASYFNNGYGNLVVVDHGGGWVTYYAHLSSIKVKVGQKLSTGDLVGYMGSTGNSTGVHLHFEIRKNGKPYNPANFLK
ncbi:M23 family metallopeptidase [Risungbinella massiliensis]|uniref:M23 family metallopeptidase n=1 Tax=Risungbinella massiliensis TaxID=1329796 RepID=UPI000699BA9A|nr:M23 family metallopeptidase [Risungbinella massiliensis]